MTVMIFIAALLSVLAGTLALTYSKKYWKKHAAITWLVRAMALLMLATSFMLLDIQLSLLRAVITWLGMITLGTIPAVFMSSYLFKDN